MAFTAQRDGICNKCNGEIKAKISKINWARTGDKVGMPFHAECEEAKTETVKPSVTVKESSGEIEEAIKKLVTSIQAPATVDLSSIVALIDERLAGVTQSRTIEIKTDNRAPVKFERAHEKIETLIKLAALRGPNGHHLNLYLHGPAGSGKTTAAHQVSLALNTGFDFDSFNPMTPDSRILGFMNVNGDYVPTKFFIRYTTGGVYCADEVDNMSASLATCLNSCIENGSGSFPHGVFPRHKDFIFIATANTVGRGGDIHYPERRALDSAFLDRFYFVEWNQDRKLIENIVTAISGDKSGEIMEWVDNQAEDLRARHPELVISPRAYIQAAIMTMAGFNRAEIAHGAISRGIK